MSESAVLEITVEDVSEAAWGQITRDLMGFVTPDMLPPDSCQGGGGVGGCGTACGSDFPNEVG